MSIAIQTALISGLIALFTTAIGSYFTWYQIQRERKKWLIDLKTAYALELYKVRLANYPEVYKIIAKLSSRSPESLTPEKAKQIALEINDWFYSVGGLCADVNTRAAVIGLREACLSWIQGDEPPDLTDWRNATLLLLRRDLDLHGLESFNLMNRQSLLETLKSEISSIE